MRKNNKGFAHIAVIMVAVMLVIVGLVGWKVWRDNKEPVQNNASREQSYGNGKIHFKNESSCKPVVKQQILERVAEPMLYYYDNILNSKLKYINISKESNSSNVQSGYILEYTDGSSSNTAMHDSGFIFGQDDYIQYWYPQLCDDGGCNDLPAEFNAKYPKNFETYMSCQQSQKSGENKERDYLKCYLF